MFKTAAWMAPLALVALANHAAAESAEQALGSAAKMLGAENLHSIEYSGSGYDFALGQAPNVKSPWPKFNDKSYTRTVNFDPWGGQNDQRSGAVIAEAKRLIPGKPVTELINTHAHFDHAGGVRAYVAEGNPAGGQIDVIDAATYEIVGHVPVGNLPHAVAVSPTGDFVMVTNALSDYISVIYAETLQEIQRFQVVPHALGLIFVQLW